MRLKNRSTRLRVRYSATVAVLCLAIQTRWNDRLRAGSSNGLHEGIGTVALVREDGLCAQMLDQFLRARDVGDPSLSDDQQFCRGKAVELYQCD